MDSPEIEIDEIGNDLWAWFVDIGRSRQSGFNGPLPLSLSDMKAWAEFTGTLVRPEEWRIIRAMDAAYLAAVADEQAEAEARRKPAK